MELNSIQKTDLTPDHKNGIHLWQFLLSLLRQPKFEKHIKWVDQNQGKFFSLGQGSDYRLLLTMRMIESKNYYFTYELYI